MTTQLPKHYDDPAEASRNAAKGRHSNWHAGMGRRQQFLEELRKGAKVPEACDAVGIRVETYYDWRRRHPGFSGLVDTARAGLINREMVAAEQVSDIKDLAVRVIVDRKRYFGHDTPAFQADLIRQRVNMKPGDIAMIMFPPLHGKTTCYEDYTNCWFGYFPHHRTHIASADIKLSKKILRRIRTRMEPTDGPLMQYVLEMGPFAPDKDRTSRDNQQPWTEVYFNIRGKRGDDERDYSCTALGFNSGVLGTRSDHLHCDDLQSMKTLAQTEKNFETWRQDWLSRPADEGICTVYGNRVDEGDIYQAIDEAFQGEDFYTTMSLPCIVQRDGEAQPLYPERWTMEGLDKMRRKVGDDQFERNWMMRPRAKGTLTFTDALVTPCKDLDRGLLQRPLASGSCLVGLDPALGGINSMLAAEVVPPREGVPGRLAVVNVEQERALTSNEEIMNRLEHFLDQLVDHGYHVTDVVIEAKNFQLGLARDERLKEITDRFGCAVREHMTNDNKYDVDVGVPSMVTTLVRKQLLIPWESEPEGSKILVSDMLRWRPFRKGSQLRQDALMALWFVWILWKLRHEEEGLVGSPSINIGGMPFQPTQRGLLIPRVYGSFMAGAR